jgi:tetratricopeptide (TPR) repeat protein
VTAAGLLERAAVANQSGQFVRALRWCQLGLNAAPGREVELELRLEKAAALVSGGDYRQATADCEHVLARRDDPRARALLARCLVETGRADSALLALEPWLEREPRAAEAWLLLARAHLLVGDAVASSEAARRALDLGLGERARTALIAALRAGARHDELIAWLAPALSNEGVEGDAELWAALGASYYALGRAEAVPVLRRAVALDPERQDAQCTLAWALLRDGHFEEGFRLHERRQRRGGDLRRYGVEPWRGESLEGKHLLVWSEQGFGDTLQFVRYVPRVRACAARTTLFVPRPLLRLLRSAAALGPVESAYPGFRAADRQTLVMSLPHWLGAADPAVESLPLFAPEAELVQQWQRRLPPAPMLALAWQGNPRYGGEPWRSMPFRHYEPLLARFASRYGFVSLQKNFGREQVSASPFAAQVLDVSAELDGGPDAFVDSLAILSLVQRLITTDTALAHLAGSAGIETWLLLGSAPDWRWQMTSHRCRYYPTMRIFRQKQPGDWDGVMREVADALERLSTPETAG